MPVRNIKTTANFAQPELTIVHSIIPEHIEQSPQLIKKTVNSHICFPKAYSLTILKPGLNSELTKCKIRRQRMEIDPNAIVALANKNELFIVLIC